jgi:uncharacterized protein involved in outer membrane biogenesis
MNSGNNNRRSVAVGLNRITTRHRKKLWASATVVALYTVLGFFLVPWLVEKLAVDTVRERYAADLRMEKVAFNPYVLGLRIDGLMMQDPEGNSFAGARQVYVNLQLSSLFRLAPTFAEIRLDAPELHLLRGAEGALNAAFLAQPAAAGSAPEAKSDGTEPPRLIVHEFAVNEATLHWRDAVPPEPVETTLGPVNIGIRNLNTLPRREGRQDVVITTETSGTLGWSGTLQLNPLRSAGRAEILGSHMELISAYIRHTSGFDLVRGNADVSFDYEIDTMADGEFVVQVNNFEFALADLLVRTFGVLADDGAPDDRDVLAVPAFNIRGGTLRWPEQSVTVNEVAISNAGLSIYRDARGAVNIAPGSNETDHSTKPDQPHTDDGSDWTVSLARLAINDMSVGLTDDSVTPQAQVGIDKFTLAISDISTADEARFPTDITVVTRTGGTISMSGTIGVLPAPAAELSIRAEGLSLSESHPYVKPLADVNLDSGVLDMNATLTSGPDDVLAYSGDIAITDFMITETDEGSRLGSWDRLALEKVVASLGNRKLAVSEVRFEKPYADVFIAEDGSFNLGRIEPGERQSTEPVDEQPEAEQGPDNPPFDVSIGRVVITDAAADFADFSLPLPFEARIAELGGELTAMVAASAEPSEIMMEGKVDDYGLLRVSGSITPLDVTKSTNIQLRFQNVEIPKFSAYTVAFAGREIASGKLDLDLGYEVTDGALLGKNRVVLRDLMLGEKIEHPGAMSLPLDLAVALLKGPDGAIDIDLPVSGDVNDPEFGYGRVIGRALVNFIVKAVTSPFALLGRLVGVEADELDHISFVVGRSDLTPPEQERIAKIAEALGLRPELVLEISGVVDREADGLALRTAKLAEAVEARIESGAGAGSSDAMYAERRSAVIEAMYREAFGAEEGALDEIRARYTSQVTEPESGRPTSRFDRLAYTADLARQLIDQRVVTEEEFVALARARIDVVRTAMIAADPALAERIRAVKLQAVEADDDRVRMDVTLKAGS